VFFVPACVSPFKKKSDLMPLRERLRLLRAALKGHPAFKLELCEIRRPGPSYTVDTLRLLKKRFGPQSTLYFICGADTLCGLSRWKSPRKVLQLCRFAVANRPCYSRPKRVRPGMVYFQMPPAAVSSTKIRRKKGPLSKRKIR
jgi:nicotinate-nucleotide adenylyltransferase